jgi:hypothetical protein
VKGKGSCIVLAPFGSFKADLTVCCLPEAVFDNLTKNVFAHFFGHFEQADRAPSQLHSMVT